MVTATHSSAGTTCAHKTDSFRVPVTQTRYPYERRSNISHYMYSQQLILCDPQPAVLQWSRLRIRHCRLVVQVPQI